MASDMFRNLMIGTIVTLLFAFLTLTFAINMGVNYGKDISELESDRVNLTGMTNTLDNLQSTSEKWQESFESQNIFSVVAGIVVTGIFDLAKTMYSIIIAPFTLLVYTLRILEVPQVVINVLLFLVVITMIFGIWRLLKQGD